MKLSQGYAKTHPSHSQSSPPPLAPFEAALLARWLHDAATFARSEFGHATRFSKREPINRILMVSRISNWSRSDLRSAKSSQPRLRRMWSACTPEDACSAGGSWLWVVLAVWMARLLAIQKMGLRRVLLTLTRCIKG